jgi:hypothetical protein
MTIPYTGLTSRPTTNPSSKPFSPFSGETVFSSVTPPTGLSGSMPNSDNHPISSSYPNVPPTTSFSTPGPLPDVDADAKGKTGKYVDKSGSEARKVE